MHDACSHPTDIFIFKTKSDTELVHHYYRKEKWKGRKYSLKPSRHQVRLRILG